MAGIDDNVGIIGDWVPPSSSPSFFAASLADDISSKSISETLDQGTNEGFFLGTQKLRLSANTDKENVSQTSDQLTELGSVSEQKSGPRGCLAERVAARAGFSAPKLNTISIKPADLSINNDIPSPYLTISPGLSPTTLLDSPVFLLNSLAQPSPTTGKFPFLPNGNGRSSISEAAEKSKDNLFEDINTSSFAFKPMTESSSSFFLGATSKIMPATLPRQSFPSIEVSVQSENSLRSQVFDPSKVHSQNRNSPNLQADFARLSTEKDSGNQRVFDTVGGSSEHSPPLDELQDEEGDQRGSGDPMAATAGGALPEDGYNWRKYGQKQVKGSEYPRSYYKCTHLNCQVKKKVERSHEGHITEIIYKGAHNHPKPPPNRRSAIGLSNPLNEMQLDDPEHTGPQNCTDGDLVWASAQKGISAGNPDWSHDNIEVTSSTTLAPEYGNGSTSLQAPNGTHFESGDAVDASSTFSNDEDEDDQGTHGSMSLCYDGEGDESESKRRKIEAYAAEMSGATRAIREPRVVVQTTSEVDILDDGYRWRKYGQKVVKGNPNPRSYYKCTSAGCTVRKHVERASHDLRSVITTYEGKHNHDVPAARSSSHVNSGGSSAVTAQTVSAVQTHAHQPEPVQVHSSMVRASSFGPITLPGRQQLGPSNAFSFGMNQPGLASLAMAGSGPGQAKLPVLPVHPFMAQQRQFMLPKGEPKAEPISEPVLNLSNNSALYQQMMSRLPLGP
ncbi:hypothetical protein SLE2022_020540 [Rubroshorea leprosula]